MNISKRGKDFKELGNRKKVEVRSTMERCGSIQGYAEELKLMAIPPMAQILRRVEMKWKDD
jgi:hypothetical protein